MPTATYQDQLENLRDCPDPPVPQRTTSLVKPTGEVRSKHIATNCMIAALFGLIAGAFFYYSHWILGGVFGLLSVMMLYAAFSSKYWVAECPYCLTVFEPLTGLSPEKEGMIVQCKNCFEYSTYSHGCVRPEDPNAVSEVPKFVSPVFSNGVWPKGCVACGAPPTRLDEVKTRNVNYAMLALGRLWVTSGKASGIPYCEKHRDAVDLKIDQQKRVTLEWCSLRMMRRYMAINRKLGCQPAGRKWI